MAVQAVPSKTGEHSARCVYNFADVICLLRSQIAPRLMLLRASKSARQVAVHRSLVSVATRSAAKVLDSTESDTKLIGIPRFAADQLRRSAAPLGMTKINSMVNTKLETTPAT